MGRLIFLVVIIHAMVFALVACGSETDQAPEKTSASKISETVEDVSKLDTRRARRSAGSMTGDTSASTEVVAEGEAVFPDPLVDEMIRLKLDQPVGPILISDLKQLTALNLGLELYVADLSGLEHLVNITELDLTQNQVTDLSPLAGLTKLTELNLWTNEISDISPPAALTDLAKINLTKNKISDLSALASLTNVTKLELTKNEITDLSPLLQTGFAEDAEIRLWGEPLDAHSIDVVIPQLEAAGVKVQF